MSILGAIGSTVSAQEKTSVEFVSRVAHAIDDLDATGLQTLAAEASDEAMKSSILLAAQVIEAANGETQEEIESNDTDELSNAISQLPGRELSLSAADVTPELISLAKETRQSLLRAALGGNDQGIETLKSSVSESQLPDQVIEELIRFANASRKLVPSFRDSPIAMVLARSNAMKTQNDLSSDSAYELLGAYRAADEKQREKLRKQMIEIRDGGQNRYSLMVAKEQERSKLITAYTEMYNAYVNGEKTKLEMIRQMQEIESEALDLKEKRALMYWALKKLRAENLFAKREKQIAKNKLRTAERSQTTAADISASWPSLFSHRVLRPHSESLRQNLATYSPANSGLISVCLVKCNGDIETLLRLLNNDLQGIPIAQRAGLQKYLRKLQIELNEPYSQNSYIAKLNDSRAETLVALTNTAATDDGNVDHLSMRLSGDDTALVSFALFRALSKSIFVAGKQKDMKALRGLAAAVRHSDLLIANHKKRLDELGSKAFRGNLTGMELDAIESPEEVLQMIAGVSSTLSPSPYKVPEKVSDEAFSILLASTLE